MCVAASAGAELVDEVRGLEVVQSGSVAELVLLLQRGGEGCSDIFHKCTVNSWTQRWSEAHQGLHHGGPLDAQVLDGLEHVHQPLSHHPLQQNVQSYEHTTATNAIAAGREGRGQTTTQWSLC